MQTLSVCSSKGGAGKTTLAAALAVAAADDGLRVGIIDIDPQQTLADWWVDRGEPDNPVLLTWQANLGVKYLPKALEWAHNNDLDLVIIDTPPAIMGIIEYAVGVADFVLVPTQPSPADVGGIQAVIDLVADAKKDFAFVINRAEPRGDALVKGTQAALKEVGPIIPAVICNRVSFRSSMGTGQSAAEVDGKKAGEEIAGLWRAVKKHLRTVARKAA